jgi:hypothetical protein
LTEQTGWVLFGIVPYKNGTLCYLTDMPGIDQETRIYKTKASAPGFWVYTGDGKADLPVSTRRKIKFKSVIAQNILLALDFSGRLFQEAEGTDQVRCDWIANEYYNTMHTRDDDVQGEEHDDEQDDEQEDFSDDENSGFDPTQHGSDPTEPED